MNTMQRGRNFLGGKTCRGVGWGGWGGFRFFGFGLVLVVFPWVFLGTRCSFASFEVWRSELDQVPLALVGGTGGCLSWFWHSLSVFSSGGKLR